ncbi:MAG: hypothetical protein D6811_07985, partial [Alphaproteobacteria bacterium]
PEQPEKGEIVAVQMSFNGLLLRMDGKVIRSQPQRIALHFMQMELESYDILSRVIMLNSTCPERIEDELSSHIGLQEPLAAYRHRRA